MKHILPLLLFAFLAFSCSKKIQPVVFDVAVVPMEAVKPPEAENPEPVPAAVAEKKVHKKDVRIQRQLINPEIKTKVQKPSPAARAIAHAKKVHKKQGKNSSLAKASKPCCHKSPRPHKIFSCFCLYYSLLQ